jgi:hypothetical protein
MIEQCGVVHIEVCIVIFNVDGMAVGVRLEVLIVGGAIWEIGPACTDAERCQVGTVRARRWRGRGLVVGVVEVPERSGNLQRDALVVGTGGIRGRRGLDGVPRVLWLRTRVLWILPSNHSYVAGPTFGRGARL